MTRKDYLKLIYTELEKSRLRNAKILMSIGDEELMLLKGHLMIEEVLFEMLKNKLKKTKNIDKARLSFSQLSTLVEGLYYEKELEVPWLYVAINKLNKIRNQLAHNTEPKNVHILINELTSDVMTNNSSDNFTPDNPLLYTLGSLHMTLAALLALSKKLSLLPEPFQSFSHSTQVSISTLITGGGLDDFA